MAISRFATSTLKQGLPKYTEFWDQSTVILNPAFESIATTTLSSSASTVTFSSIPGTYQHLQLRMMGKVSFSSSADWWRVGIQLNSTNAVYSHTLEGNGSTASANNQNSSFTTALLPSSHSSLDNMFGVSIIDIHDYASTTKAKTGRAFFGFDANTALTPRMGLGSILFTSTSAVTSLTVYVPGGTTDLASGSTFALYGIKGAV